MADYDIAVIGAGPGGYVAAIRAAQLGAKVVVIEKDKVGGTCLNRGCIPSKVFLEASKLYSQVKKEGAKFGIVAPEVSFDWSALMARKNDIVGKLCKGVAGLFKKNGVELIEGEARFADPHTLEVGDRKVSADFIIIATGTVPARPGFLPFDGKKVITSDEMLDLEPLPKRALIVGGGYIGCEFATVLSELECQVTVVEMLDRLLPVSDQDVSKEIFKAFKRKRVQIHLGTKIEKMEVVGDVVKATVSGGKEPIEADIALVSIGRAPVSGALNLEAAGLAADERGLIPADDMCQTKAPHIYAIGDINGKMQLAHVASRHGINAVEHIMGKRTAPGYRVVPAGVFTHPEVGAVGMTEAEAREGGREVQIGAFHFRGLGKAMAMGETDGFVKLIAEAESGQILGAHVVGAHATDLAAEIALAIEHEATLASLADVIHAHPTLSEANMEAAEAAEGKAIHG